MHVFTCAKYMILWSKRENNLHWASDGTKFTWSHSVKHVLTWFWTQDSILLPGTHLLAIFTMHKNQASLCLLCYFQALIFLCYFQAPIYWQYSQCARTKHLFVQYCAEHIILCSHSSWLYILKNAPMHVLSPTVSSNTCTLWSSVPL